MMNAMNGPTETLPALIDQATRSLAEARTYAEVLEVKADAQMIYDAAKTAARIARAKQAHDSVLVGVAEAQGKALAIEARAEIRLAEEYEAAQDRGEVAKNGGDRTSVPGENTEKPATSAEIGIDRKDIHRGRKLAAAEAAEPGVIERSIGEIVEAGEEPTKAALARKLDTAPKKPKPEPNPVADAALWVWGRIKDFERDETLRLDPAEVFAKMTQPMKEDVRRLLPRVQTFLNRLEKTDE